MVKKKKTKAKPLETSEFFNNNISDEAFEALDSNESLNSLWLSDEDPKFNEFIEYKSDLSKTAAVLGEEDVNFQHEAAKFLADRPDRPDVEGLSKKAKFKIAM
jgi:hypothetical protein